MFDIKSMICILEGGQKVKQFIYQFITEISKKVDNHHFNFYQCGYNIELSVLQNKNVDYE